MVACLVHLSREQRWWCWCDVQGRKLLVLCTTSCKDILREMQMLSVFTKIVHVSNISRPEHLLACLDHLSAFTPREMDQVRRWASSGKRYRLVVMSGSFQLPVEIKLSYYSGPYWNCLGKGCEKFFVPKQKLRFPAYQRSWVIEWLSIQFFSTG